MVDQFEELFRYRGVSGKTSGTSECVCETVVECAYRRTPDYVVITMRSDYLGDCAHLRFGRSCQ